jgi:hypothetical protein
MIVSTGHACKVPVFRFALERWESDDYILLFRDAGDAPDLTGANITARHSPQLEARFAAHYPESLDLELPPFWTGEEIGGLLDSPLRQRLLEMLSSGTSTVWVLVEGANPEENGRIEANLASLLATAASSIAIPDGVVRPEQLDTGEIDLAMVDAKDVLRSPIPLGIDFKTLRLGFADPAEATFRKMLLGAHPDPSIRNGAGPLLVPIFGRGRMLEPLPAAMLNQETVSMASQYLCGECSCEVKDQNPGADILLTADWEGLLRNRFTIIDQQLPPLAGAGEFEPSLEPAPSVQSTPVSQLESSPLPRNLFLLALAGVGALTLFSAVILRSGG